MAGARSAHVTPRGPRAEGSAGASRSGVVLVFRRQVLRRQRSAPHALLMQLFAEGSRCRWHRSATPGGRSSSAWGSAGGQACGWRAAAWCGKWQGPASSRCRWRGPVIDNPAIDRAEFVRSTLMKRLGKEEFETLIRTARRCHRGRATHGVSAGASSWRNAVPQYISCADSAASVSFMISPGRRRVFSTHSPRNVQIACLTSPKGSKLLAEIGFDAPEMFGAFDQARSAGTEPRRCGSRWSRSRVAIALEEQRGPDCAAAFARQIGSLSK